MVIASSKRPVSDGASCVRRDTVTTESPGDIHDPIERRAHRRLEIRLPVGLRRLGDNAGPVVRTITENISTGGMYLELNRPDFRPGDRLAVEVKIPAAEGVSPYPGMGTCEAEVVRCGPTARGRESGIQRVGLAARFLDRLRISY